jgi:hypothetical protein
VVVVQAGCLPRLEYQVLQVEVLEEIPQAL